jgi:hypothetical protein
MAAAASISISPTRGEFESNVLTSFIQLERGFEFVVEFTQFGPPAEDVLGYTNGDSLQRPHAPAVCTNL